MENTNTVTITIDEYLDLKTKAEAHFILSNEFDCIQSNFENIYMHLSDAIEKIVELERRIMKLEPAVENCEFLTEAESN